MALRVKIGYSLQTKYLKLLFVSGNPLRSIPETTEAPLQTSMPLSQAQRRSFVGWAKCFFFCPPSRGCNISQPNDIALPFRARLNLAQ